MLYCAQKPAWVGLICRTYQHYHLHWLPYTEWSYSDLERPTAYVIFKATSSSEYKLQLHCALHWSQNNVSRQQPAYVCRLHACTVAEQSDMDAPENSKCTICLVLSELLSLKTRGRIQQFCIYRWASSFHFISCLLHVRTVGGNDKRYTYINII